MIQKHYYYFGEDVQSKMKGNALNEQNWDILRTDEYDSPFSIEKSIEAYESNCMNQLSYEKAARIIVDELEKRGLSKYRLISLGAGKGILECI